MHSCSALTVSTFDPNHFQSIISPSPFAPHSPTLSPLYHMGTKSLKNKNSDLRKSIENLEKNSVTSLRTLVNLGSEVYMQADVPDTRRIFVDVGLGFHVEFTWSEALNYIIAREEKLARQIEEYTRLIASIKAQIKMVCEGIRELLQLPGEGSY
ncbi:hypothetical protein HYC85_008127 [Camellia sinensis]|uniref:Uncharacterized protein n=1 Tax=Camellia sinensis TaxID=4442 RepID=A0A7J7HSQ7_CAMSI|nr:hypothetical protein HYC85_008127 [Camellia sinensis]